MKALIMRFLPNLLPGLGAFANPWVLVGVLAVAAAVGAGGFKLGWDVRDDIAAKEEIREQRIVEKMRAANRNFADAIAERTETAIGGIRVQTKVINNEVRHEREIHHVLDSVDCGIELSTIRVLNRARGYDDGGAPAGEPDERLPAAGQTTGGQEAAGGGAGAGGR